MMRLQVTVELSGEIVEDTVLNVTDGLRLGEHEEAVVAFPGLDIVLSSSPDDVVLIRGHRLRDGDCYTLTEGNVRVTMRPVIGAWLARNKPWQGDLTLPVLLMAVILFTLTAQTMVQVFEASPDVSDGVARTVEAWLLPPELRAAPNEPSTVQPTWARSDGIDRRPAVHFQDRVSQ
ncbi:MAG: hypothetical protein AB8H79_08295 [Myxococcota bacterium]